MAPKDEQPVPEPRPSGECLRPLAAFLLDLVDRLEAKKTAQVTAPKPRRKKDAKTPPK